MLKIKPKIYPLKMTTVNSSCCRSSSLQTPSYWRNGSTFGKACNKTVHYIRRPLLLNTHIILHTLQFHFPLYRSSSIQNQQLKKDQSLQSPSMKQLILVCLLQCWRALKYWSCFCSSYFCLEAPTNSERSFTEAENLCKDLHQSFWVQEYWSLSGELWHLVLQRAWVKTGANEKQNSKKTAKNNYYHLFVSHSYTIYIF